MALASVYTADFQRPKSVPGYGGFTPTLRFSNGCTFGTATRRFYESSKLEELSTSVIQSQRKNNLNTNRRPGSGGHNPNYALSHIGPRRTEVLQFDSDAQTHRQQYKDHTGTYPRVASFVHRRIASAPVTRMDRWLVLAGPHLFHEQFIPLVSTYDRSLLYSNRVRPHNGMVYTRRTNALERATRDQFFQRR